MQKWKVKSQKVNPQKGQRVNYKWQFAWVIQLSLSLSRGFEHLVQEKTKKTSREWCIFGPKETNKPRKRKCKTKFRNCLSWLEHVGRWASEVAKNNKMFVKIREDALATNFTVTLEGQLDKITTAKMERVVKLKSFRLFIYQQERERERERESQRIQRWVKMN